MKINIKYRANLAELTKTMDDSVEAVTVKEILKHIKKLYGTKAKKLAKTMLIVVNGQSILLLKRFKTKLKDGDEVGFLPICGGG